MIIIIPDPVFRKGGLVTSDPLNQLQTALGGTYVFRRELGGGGMSRVFEADETALGRTVVIKVLPPDLAAGVNVDRFRREIQLAAQLRHPHIIPLLNAGEASGMLYYTMPFVRGESLSARLARDGRLSVREAVTVAREVADALDYAHRQGVVHRDIKPANILLEDGHAVVADFGIARAVKEAARTNASALTATGLVLGTPLYMSPEQASGEGLQDGRGDIYSLGCVLYEMLAGHPPFRGATAQAVIVKHFVGDPEPLRTSRVNVPPLLEGIVATALAKAPQDRFATAADFRDALAAVDTSRLDATPPARPSLTMPGARTVTTPPATGQIDSVAVLPFTNGSGDAEGEYLSDGITESILNKLTRVSGLRVVPRSTVFRYKGKDVDLPTLAAELRVRAVVTGRIVQRGNTLLVTAELTDAQSESQLWGDRYTRPASDIFAVQEEMAAEITRSLRVRLSAEDRQELVRRYTDDALAYRAYLRGRYCWNKRSRDAFLQAIGHFQEAIERDPGYALAYAALADTYNLTGYYNYQPPLEAYPRAEAAARRALEIDETLAAAHAAYGYSRLFFGWDWDAAAAAFRRAIELDPAYASAHQWYGWYWLAMEQPAAMVAAMREALQLDPLSLIINAHMGYAYFFAGQDEQALDQLARTETLDPTFAMTYWPLGAVYVRQQRWDEAIAAFRRVVKLSDEQVGLGFLGFACGLAGRVDDAQDVLARLDALADTRYVSPLEFAITHAALGDVDAAFLWLRRSVVDRASDLIRLKVLPFPQVVREDARFAELVREVGLPALQPPSP